MSIIPNNGDQKYHSMAMSSHTPQENGRAIVPRDNDILLGRGFAIMNHPGNQRLRSLVKSKKPEFHRTKRQLKRDMACDLVEDVLRSGRRFLAEDPTTKSSSRVAVCDKQWVCVEREKAVSKVMHLFREKEKDERQQQAGPSSSLPPPSMSSSSVSSFGERGAVASADMGAGRPPFQNVARANNGTNTSPNVMLQSIGNLSLDAGGTSSALSPAHGPMSSSSPVNSRGNMDNGLFNGSQSTHDANSMQQSTPSLHHTIVSQLAGQCSASPGLLNSGGRPSPLFSGQSSASPGLLNTDGGPSPLCSGQSSANSGLFNSGGRPSPLCPSNGNLDARMPTMDQTTYATTSTGSAISMSIKQWTKSAGERCSKTAYILGAVELAWMLTKHLSDTIESSATMNLSEFTSETVLVLISGAGEQACMRGVQFPHLMQSDPWNSCGNGPSVRQRDACAWLGKMLLEVFSMNQSSFMDPSSPAHDDSSNGMPPSAKKKTSSMANSTSSTSNNLLLSLVMPVSISRLVCDLMDATNEPPPSSAITSIDEALWDLEQMKSDPQSFLFDQTSPEKALERFRVADDHLFGRERELAALMQAKETVSSFLNDNGTNTTMSQGNAFFCEVALLSGYSGCGKSSLVRRLAQACNENQWFVLGCKFDKHVPPVKALFKALDDFFGEWGELDGAVSNFHPTLMGSFGQVCGHICSTIDHDGFRQLSDLAPNLSRLHRSGIQSGHHTHTGISPMERVGSGRNRVQNLFQVILKSLCSAGIPVLFTLDSLQWCDSFALETLTDFVANYMHGKSAIESESCRRGLFIAGTYRSHEVNEGDYLFERVNYLTQSKMANVTTIDVGELMKDDITKLVSAKLCLPWRYTRQLAELVHSKTRGNPFFVTQFLQTIVSNNMLAYSVRTRRWEWDYDVVDMQMISDGVAELLATSFSRLPSALMQTMKVASCFGCQVDMPIIEAVDSSRGVLPFSMLEQMQLAVKEGILEQAGPLYQFTHTILRQTIYDLIPSDSRPLLQRALGESLLKSGSNDPTIHLLAVEQINAFCKDGHPSHEECSQFASINAQGAKFAIAASSFERARLYIDSGIKLLKDDHWESQYTLSLDLYEMSASACCTSGDIAKMSTCLEEIMSHVKTFDDSLTSAGYLAQLLSSSSQFKEATGNCLEILSKLGETFPSEVSPPIVMKELCGMGALLKKVTHDQIKRLSPMTDRRKLHAMKFLNILCSCTFISQPLLFPLLCSRMVKLSLEFGFCDDTIVGLASTGYSVYLFTNDLDLSTHLQKVSESLIEESPKKHFLRSRLCRELVTTLRMMKEPSHSVVALYPNLYNSAMLAGDVQSAVVCRFGYCASAFWTGALSLKSVLNQLMMCMKEASKYQQKMFLLIMMTVCNSCSYMLESNGTEFEVKSLDELNGIGLNTKNVILVWHVFVCRLTNSFWQNEYAIVAELSEQYAAQNKSPLHQKHILNVPRSLYEGIAHLNLARSTGQTKYRSLGENAVAKFAEWANNMSAWNFRAQSQLLQAELHYVDGNLESAETAYQASVKSAREHKLIHDEALACELYGKFCVENDMRERGSEQLRAALDKYREWGALRKARQLEAFIDAICTTDPLARQNYLEQDDASAWRAVAECFE